MNKKIMIVGLIAAIGLSVSSFAAGFGTFNASGDGATAVVEPRIGTPLCASMNVVDPSNGNVNVYVQSIKGTVKTASATNSLVINSTSTGAVAGHVMLSTDNILVYNSTGGYQFRALSSATADGTNLVTLGFTGNIVASIGDAVWIGKVGNVVTIPVSGGKTVNSLTPFVGIDGMPLVVKMTAGGGATCVVSGVLEYK